MSSNARIVVGDRRHIRKLRQALRPADGERLELAAFDMRRRRRRRQDGELGAAGQRVLDALRHGGVGHLQDIGAARLVQPGRQDAGEIPFAVGGEGELARIGLIVGDQSGQSGSVPARSDGPESENGSFQSHDIETTTNSIRIAWVAP